MNRRIQFRAVALALLAAGVLATAGVAHAEVGPMSTSVFRVAKYVGCALGMAGAATGIGLAMATLSCLLLVMEP